MATFLFDQIVYGPVHSRRLGVSLGVNISPADGKRCSFNCIYCECGLNEQRRATLKSPRREEVQRALETKLLQLKAVGIPPEVITFSGNGEPTLHPVFAGIIDDTLALRDRLCPQARVAVLTNSTMLHKEDVFQALCRVDDNIMKLDSVSDRLIQLIDDPGIKDFSVEKLIHQLCRFGGRLIIQTMFLRGERDGIVIDNTRTEEIAAWIAALKKINPHKVMIYTIDRETPVKTLQKLPASELETIAGQVRKEGFEVTVAL
jgi:wyosine [tRNA(Phe)-imidazoG37] synthetase (radical SAM superfamily)